MDAVSYAKRLSELSDAIGTTIRHKSTTGATGLVGLAPHQHMHDGPYCRWVKTDPERHRACQDCYTRRRLWEEHGVPREGGVFRCHAGVFQVGVPVLHGNQYTGILLAGEFRAPAARPPWKDPVNLSPWRDLKVMEARRVTVLLGTLQVLAGYLDHLKSRLVYPRGSVEHPGLARALVWMQGAPSADLSVKQAAAVAKLSPSRFVHLFSELTGGTFSAYRIRSRLEKAKTLLVETDHSIADIADRAGYARQSHFAQLFRHHLGMSPGQYRKRARQTPP